MAVAVGVPLLGVGVSVGVHVTTVAVGVVVGSAVSVGVCVVVGGGVTLGVEEEFVLLDPSTGATVLAGPDLVRMLDGDPGVQAGIFTYELHAVRGFPGASLP